VNIVLRVREADCTVSHAECPGKKKQQKQPEQWGNIQQAQGIKKWKKASLDVFAK